MATILQLPALNNPSREAVFYTAQAGKNYHATFAALLSLINKRDLELDKVDNTSDADKPISTAAAQALAQKANANEVPTLTAFTAAVESLSNYVKQEQLNEAIAAINAKIESGASEEDVALAIAQTVAPINEAIGRIQNTILAHTQDLQTITTKLESTVTGSTLTSALAASEQRMSTQLQGFSNSMNESLAEISQRFASVNQSLSSFSEALLQKADKTHEHVPTDIQGLDAYIAQYTQANSNESVRFLGSTW